MTAKEALPGRRVAALDLGTNTFRVLIADVKSRSREVGKSRGRQSAPATSRPLELSNSRTPDPSTSRPLDLTPIRVLRAITRLGQDLHKRRTFHPDAVKRSLTALDDFDREIRKHRVDWAGGICTAAFRTAKNGPALLARIRKRYGWDVRIVSAKQEATYAMRGILHGLAPEGRVTSRSREVGKSRGRQSAPATSRPLELSNSRFLVIDIGGGSTEFILYDGRSGGRKAAVLRAAGAAHAEGGAVRGIQTTPLGVVRLTETFLHHDPPTPSEMAALTHAIDHELRSVERRFGRELGTLTRPAATLSLEGRGQGEGSPRFSTPDSRLTSFVGTAGTVTTLAALKKKMRRYDPEKISGTRLTRRDLESLMRRLIAVPAKSRLQFPGMEKGREDLILAGIAILLRCLDRFHLRDLLVSDSGILEGIGLSAPLQGR